MKDLALPGQKELFDVQPEQRASNTAADWRRLKGQGARIVAMMLDAGGWWSLAMIRERLGGSDTGNSARLRDARKLGYLLHTDRRGDGVWVYKLEPSPGEHHDAMG